MQTTSKTSKLPKTLKTSKTSKSSKNTPLTVPLENSDSMSQSESNTDVYIEVLNYNPINSTYNNYLVLGMTGNKINNVILNTLRRAIMELIPTYAFDKKNIDITKNTSIYNNDQMRLRLSHFPIFGIDNKYETILRSEKLEYEANISTFEKKVEDLNVIEEMERAQKIELAQNLIMSVNAKNTTANNLAITTSDEFVKFYYETKLIDSPYESPLLIIKLKPGEEFRCTATSSLNIGLKGANYMPNSVCVFSEPLNTPDADGNLLPASSKHSPAQKELYTFNLESLKQMSEMDILIRACAIINIKLVNFMKVITEKIIEYKSDVLIDEYNLEDNIIKLNSDSDSIVDSAIRNTSDDVLEEHRIKGIIRIENESHTFGNLLTRGLQEHPAIIFAGYKIDHLLVKELTIGYKTNGKDIVEIFNEIINDHITTFEQIKKQIENLDV